MRIRRAASTTRWNAMIAAVCLVFAACSGTAADDTTTTSTDTTAVTATTVASTTTTASTTTVTTVSVRPIAEIPTFADDDVEIGFDPAVTVGTLDNGLVYYIRENDRPGKRAQLRLAVRAGSVQEETDQSGGAHFLEHMLFNGTEKYPANELIGVLQEFGMEFGPDVNAYTTWEETVYELTLPTDRAELLPTGLDVLHEWATAATIDPEQVDLERGVLVEEWRLRSQSFGGRYLDGVVGRLLAGSPYEGQFTLAGPELVESTTPEALRAFYEDWYRPDNMAVVAVGDFDVADVEQLIIEIFDDLPATQGPRHPDLATEAATEPAFMILADPEFQQSFVELNYPLPSLPEGTVGTLRQEMAFNLAWDMMVTRLEEDALSGGAVYFDPSLAANPLVRTQRSPGLFAWCDPDELAATAEALLGEVERVLIHGFTQDELDRAVEAVRSLVDVELQRSGTTQDAEYAQRYVEHYLGDHPAPTADDSATLQHRLLDEMTLDQVIDTFRASVQATEPFIIVVGPEDAVDELPTEDDLAGILSGVRAADFEERTDGVVEIESLMEAPGLTAAPRVDALPASALEILTLENGARVILIQTDIVENTVVVGASSFGGWSLVPEADAAEASLAGPVVSSSGIAAFNQVSLDRFLADRAVYVVPYIEETVEGLYGQASTDEIETLFQLMHLYATQPRIDAIGVNLLLDQVRPYAADPTSSPDLAVALEMADARFGGDPRFLPVPSVEDLDTFDPDTALAIFRERFADASNFVWVVSGDFDRDTAEGLVRRYVGSLPSTESGETYADIRIERPRGILERVVESGSGELGQLSLLWDAPMALDPVTRVEVDLLDLVIRQRLTERIREELSATYSPFTSVVVVDDPVPSVELAISISANPGDLESIIDEVIADLTDLRDHGPTADQLAIAQEQLIRSLELFSNEGLIELLTFYLQRPQEDPGDIFDAIDRAAATTVADLQALSRELVALDDFIQVRLIPEGSAG